MLFAFVYIQKVCFGAYPAATENSYLGFYLGAGAYHGSHTPICLQYT